MRFKVLAGTGLRVSAVGLGASNFGGTCDAAVTAAIVDRALGLGVNFIDTAEVYPNPGPAGASEELLGIALAGRRHDVVLCTKVGWIRPESGREPAGTLTQGRIAVRLEASLRRLGTDYIDLYYLHRPDPLTPLEESLHAVGALITAGKVRYAACSNYPASEVAEMVAICDRAKIASPVASQVPYNLLDRSAEAEMIPACEHFGLSLVPYRALAGGFLTGKYRRGAQLPPMTRLELNERLRRATLTEENFDKLERYQAFAGARNRSVGELAIAWLVAQPVVGPVIVGATSPRQVEINVRAGDWTLSPEELSALS
jgi:aryl-alcohol dehydrogenase-like predicted oxidoreductase